MLQDVQIIGRNLDVTDRIRDYTTKKVSKLDRYLSDIEETRVDLAYVKSARNASDRQVAQITVRGRGFILRAEERADDIFAALDSALDKIQRRIERYKGKRHRNRVMGPSPADFISDVFPEEEEEEEGPLIARRKHFLLTPMDEYEAIEQMELLGHENFFVFYNANTDVICVLYKRRDGSYGLIEPEVA
jgi:putative sigma-54 modulation protein